jgi:hypothetical protein
MSRSATTRWQSARPWIGFYLAVLLSRVVLIAFPPAGGLYNIDELDMTLSVLDRFLGLPSTSLAWPGATLQLLTTPIFGARLAAGCLGAGPEARNLACLATGLGRLYLHPFGLVATVRLVSAVVSSATPVLVALAIRRLGESAAAAWITGISIALLGSLWQQEAMATGDALAIALALGGIVTVLASAEHPARPVVSGLLVGAAVASKITVSAMGLAPALLIALNPAVAASARIRSLLRWLAGVALAFAFCCPFVWTDPTRLFKAIVGNVGRAGAPVGVAGFGALLPEAGGPLFWILLPMAVLGGAVLFADRRRRWIGWALAITVVLMAVPVMRAGVVFPRYALPLIVVLAIPMGTGLSALFDRVPGRVRPALVAAFCLPALFGSIEAIDAQRSLRDAKDDFAGLQSLLADVTTGELYLPSVVYGHTLPELSRADIQRMRKAAARLVANPAAAVSFLVTHGIDPAAAEALAGVFDDSEQAWLGRYAVMEPQAPQRGRTLHFYALYPPDAARSPMVDTSEPGAIDAFLRSHGAAGLLVRERVPVLEPSGRQLGGGWHLYEKAGLNGLTGDLR